MGFEPIHSAKRAAGLPIVIRSRLAMTFFLFYGVVVGKLLSFFEGVKKLETEIGNACQPFQDIGSSSVEKVSQCLTNPGPANSSKPTFSPNSSVSTSPNQTQTPKNLVPPSGTARLITGSDSHTGRVKRNSRRNGLYSRYNGFHGPSQ
jgi:hypothetical protein